ncbi:hypothetical protein CALVIDRAFT_560766 [Calocera viscosa TUFC12733]|uniref:Transcription initiation factor IIF subunit alpha n=1 Tax=Calocera viscosa (strain TUFC12733) TaxID=1330018 RepID=A0A167QRG6_CALVF|nr:hypothetical protein CALVIDRAFT_560766 [Calocera viscosa TUFC12733]
MASRIKAEFKNDPMELKPLGRRQQPVRPPPPRPAPSRPGQSKAFVQPDIKPKVESKPLPEDPPGTYTDFVITSSGISEWRHDMMRFRPTNMNQVVNPMDWIRPVKLNRKELKKNYKAVDKIEPARPLLGLDGKPVVGPDGKIVMVGGPDGLLPNGRARPKDNGKGKDKDQPKRKFKRTKTRQVFRVSDEVRAVRREERHPWVMESADGAHVWEGRLEDRGPQLQVLLFQSQKEGFVAVPLSKWYTFKEPPKHTILTLDQAEQFEKDLAKSSDIQRWMMRKTGGRVSEATQLTLKRESSAEPARPRANADGSIHARSGARMLQVRTGNAADYGDQGDDDEGAEGAGSRRRRERERGGGGDGDYDEFEYEEEFQDDDEGAILPDDEEEDEETKALKEKEARMMRAANAVNDENRMDEDGQEEDEDEDEDELNDAGKAMKKALKLWEKGAYADEDDDDNKNPYLSSEEEEEEEGTESGSSTPLPTGVLPQASTPGKSGTPRPNGSASKPTSRNISRAGSPVGGRSSNGISGASVLAHRATSPPPGTSRLPAVGGVAARALSPLAAEAGGRRASSPPRTAPAASSLKRKAPDDVSSPPGGRGSSPGPTTAASPGSSNTPNKRPRTLPRVAVPASLVFDKAIPPGPIIAFLRMKPRTTGDCVKNFKDWFKEDARNKNVLSFWIKQIAKLDNSSGESVLKLHDDAKLAQMGIEF